MFHLKHLFTIVLLVTFCFVIRNETIQNQDFQEISREEMIQLRNNNFFKRILQESQLFFDRQTQSNDGLGRLVLIREKVTGIMSQYKLRFLNMKGFYQIQVNAIEPQNIINFISLKEIGNQSNSDQENKNNL